MYVKELARALGGLGTAVDVYTREHPGCRDQIEFIEPSVRVVHLPVGVPEASVGELYPHLPEFLGRLQSFLELGAGGLRRCPLPLLVVGLGWRRPVGSPGKTPCGYIPYSGADQDAVPGRRGGATGAGDRRTGSNGHSRPHNCLQRPRTRRHGAPLRRPGRPYHLGSLRRGLEQVPSLGPGRGPQAIGTERRQGAFVRG